MQTEMPQFHSKPNLVERTLTTDLSQPNDDDDCDKKRTNTAIGKKIKSPTSTNERKICFKTHEK